MEQPPTRRRKARPLLITFALLAACLAAYTAWRIALDSPGNADFYLRRGRYEGVVAKAKALPLAPGARASAMVDGLKVDIGRSPSGSYTVTITTADWHHAGAYGYVFSDTPLVPRPDANYPDHQGVENPGDMPFADKSIVGQGGRWWSVYNDLN